MRKKGDTDGIRVDTIGVVDVRAMAGIGSFDGENLAENGEYPGITGRSGKRTQAG